MRRYFTLMAAAAGLMLGTTTLGTTAAQAYPDRPVTLVVAFGAGGSTDVTARMLAPFIARELNGEVEVVNRTGGGGEIGFAAIADAAPDGYTIGFVNSPNVVTIPIERQARFSLDRFDPLVNIVDDPSMMAVANDSPFANLTDLINHARENAGRVVIGSTGAGSDDHLAIIMLQRQAAIRLTHAPFSGSDDVINSVISGRISATGGTNLGEGIRVQQTQPIRFLGIMSEERAGALPDVPTFKEQGVDIVLASLRGIAAPRGLPPEIRARLVEAITNAVNDPEFVAQANTPATFQPLRVLGPDAFAAELARMDQRFRALWETDPWSR